jgi:hypothetical protein
MTDRELLELAAFAADIKTSLHKETDSLWIDGPRVWNPITDDGDALRLAVKLRLDICRPHADYHSVCVWLDQRGDFVEQEVGEDPYAATRRAIVRAAAEIGKEMK